MSGSDLLMRLDEHGRVSEWSPAACEVFGRAEEEAVGRSVAALVDDAGGDGAWLGARSGQADSVVVKPVLAGHTVVWEVRASVDTVSGRDLATLRAMFTHSPVGLHVLDERLNVVRVNTATSRLSHAPGGSPLGRPFTEVYRLADPAAEAAAARGVLETGEPVLDRLVCATPWPVGSESGNYSVFYVRLDSVCGEVLGLVASVLDVTDRERALQRLKVLEEVRSRVGERLEIMAVCEALADAVVPAFARIAVGGDRGRGAGRGAAPGPGRRGRAVAAGGLPGADVGVSRG